MCFGLFILVLSLLAFSALAFALQHFTYKHYFHSLGLSMCRDGEIDFLFF